MALAAEYKRQFQWRSWPQIFAAVPLVAGERVIDLGCAIGDQAAELVARGAHVVGVDANRELLDVARSRALRTPCGPAVATLRAEFRAALARDDHRSRARVVCCVAYK